MLARTISYTILHGGTQVSQCREQLTFHLSLAKAGRKEKTMHRVILHDSHMVTQSPSLFIRVTAARKFKQVLKT